MNGPGKRNAAAAYGSLACCVLLAWALCLAGAGIWPFGGTTLSPIDNLQQMAADYGSIPRLLQGSESLWWTFASGGAIRNFLATCAHNVLMPTTWLAWLMPWDTVVQALSWQLLLQLLASAMACCWYLRRRYTATPCLWQLILAFSYAFSHYFLTKYTCLAFLNISALFPLYLAALDSLLERRHTLPYILFMALMMAFASYFAWMYGLFALVYAFANRSPKRLWHQRGVLLTLTVCTALAALLSAAVALPSVVHMLHSSRAGDVSTDWLTAALIFPNEVTIWTLLPPACVCLCLAPAERLKAILLSRQGLTAAALTICLLSAGLIFIWCMGAPMAFMSRFSYMLSMMLCCMACRSVRRAIPLAPAWPRVLVLVAGLGVLLLLDNHLLRLEPCHLVAARWGFAIGMGLFALLLMLHRRLEACLGLSVIGVVAAFCAFHHSQHPIAEASLESRDCVISHEYRLNKLAGVLAPDAASRLKSIDLALASNGGEYSRFHRFANNMQSIQSRQKESMNRLGYFSWWVRQCDIGGSALGDAFLSFRYMAAERPVMLGLAPCLHAEEGLYLYENPFYWGFGALVKSADIPQNTNPGNPIDYTQCLYDLLAGRHRPLFRIIPAPLVNTGSGLSLRLPEETRDHWCYIRPYAVRELCDLPVFNHVPYMVQEDYGRNLFQLPTNRSGQDIEIPLPATEQQADMYQQAFPQGALPVYVLDTTLLQELADEQRGCAKIEAVRPSGLDLLVKPRHGKDMLMLPLLYHEGYTAHANDTTLEIIDTLGFVGIVLPEPPGEELALRLRFTSPYQTVGMILTLFGVLLTLLWYYRPLRSPALGTACYLGGYIIFGLLALWVIYWAAAFAAHRLF